MLRKQCESGGIGRRTRLRIWRGNPWGFKSPLSHHIFSYLKAANKTMSQMKPSPEQPRVNLTATPDYRDGYANSVQIRMSVWDFHLVFGTLAQSAPGEISVSNFQGIYLSPQQAKALLNVLGHNVAQYEQTFGPIALDQQLPHATGPVH